MRHFIIFRAVDVSKYHEASNIADHAKTELHKAAMMCFVGASPKAEIGQSLATVALLCLLSSLMDLDVRE